MLAVDIDDLDSVRGALIHAYDLRQIRRRCCSGLLLETLEVRIQLCTVDSHFTGRWKLDRTWC